ncbi:DNA-binding transcriptional regulator [Caldimonas tepidiphila]|uniref:DNA-binding transcriptional regulator n=1 Tax=Caldimonas tepidiphila TaxID=2315841 RepID=UPI000E5B13C5|nr:DNA-binding transcriptional regulator [Caldimonas tepidiphila]
MNFFAEEDAPAPYKEVRGLARGLTLLKALNRLPGGISSTSELARACGLDRTTTKRLLETLRAQGFVRQGEREGQYYLTFEVRRLSEGFEDEAWVARIASPAMQAAVRELVWPCDLATAEAGFMVVRESTHRWSALSQHRAMIGERLPLLQTAIGRAYLAWADEAEREALLELLRRRDDRLGELARDAAFVRRLLRQTRTRGYAVNEGEWIREADFAAVAVPVHAGERLLAALNLVFPKAAVSDRELRQRFVPALQRLADTIGRGSRAWVEN